MTARVDRRAAPTLFGSRAAGAESVRIQSLLDLMHEGFYVLTLLKGGSAPPPEEVFQAHVLRFLQGFEREARRLRAHGDDIEAAKYAYCAALDEAVLSSTFAIRGAWERRPMQLAVFGDQLAGEHFYDRLDELRGKGGARLQALQVFHMCLLLGFRGKYGAEGADKLAWLTSRLGDEIAHIKGKARGFAPRGERPDQVAHKLRGSVPLWAVPAAFALVALCAYGGMKASLDSATRRHIAAYADLVKLAPSPASFTVTLP